MLVAAIHFLNIFAAQNSRVFFCVFFMKNKKKDDDDDDDDYDEDDLKSFPSANETLQINYFFVQTIQPQKFFGGEILVIKLPVKA